MNKLKRIICGCCGTVLGVLKLSHLSKAYLLFTNRKLRKYAVTFPQANTAHPILQPQSQSLITMSNTIIYSSNNNSYSEEVECFLHVNKW